jgi:hypothetical protein
MKDMINRKTLDQLINIQSEICISLYIPTYRAGNSLEDKIRFKNILNDTRDNLQKRGMSKKEALRFLAKGYELLDRDKFWLEQSDGLAVFISDGHFSHYVLPLDFEIRSIIDNIFYIRPLLPLFSEDKRFFLLALSQNKVRFFEANRYSITPVIIDDIVPANMEVALRLDEPAGTLQMHGATSSRGSAIFHGQGIGKDHHIKRLSDYFTLVDEGLMTMLHDEKAPMLIATVDSNFPIYQEVSQYPALMNVNISGNPDHMDPIELHERAWHIMRPIEQEERKQASMDFRDKLSTGKASVDPSVIVPAAIAGKVEHVFLDSKAMLYGRYMESLHKVEINDRKQPDNQELLEVIARKVFEQGGTVFNVDRSEFPMSQSPVNATMRF